MHTVQLLLKTSKYERHEIDRRFHALAHLHNVCVKHARKCMIRLQHDKRYAELRQLYNELVKKEKMSKEEKSQKKKLAKQLAACRTEQGLSKASLEHYLKVCGKQFSKLLSSQQVQAEAPSLPSTSLCRSSLGRLLPKELWRSARKCAKNTLKISTNTISQSIPIKVMFICIVSSIIRTSSMGLLLRHWRTADLQRKTGHTTSSVPLQTRYAGGIISP